MSTRLMSTRQSGQPLSVLRWLLLLACILLPDPCPAKTLYVDDNAPAGGDGLHWASAFCHLQDALAVAELNNEIRVAQGLYYPDRGENLVLGDRSATFELRSGVVIFGGYGGLSCEDPSQRDVDQYASILCGDLLDNDLQGGGTFNDNSFNIMTAIGKKLILELGKSLVNYVFFCATKCISEKTRNGIRYLFFDAGVNATGGNHANMNHDVILPMIKKEGAREGEARLFGPMCFPSDIISESTTLPLSFGENDILLIPSSGAYTLTLRWKGIVLTPRPLDALELPGHAPTN